MKRALVVAIACAGCYDFGSLGTKPSQCSSFGGFVCDGFEDQLPAPPGWSDLHGATTGSITVDNSRAYRGSYSLHVHADASSGTPTTPAEIGGRVSANPSTFAVPLATQIGLHVFLRMFLYLPSLSGGRLFLLEAGRRSTANVPYDGVAAVIDEGGSFFLQQANSGGVAGMMAPTGRWVCVELAFDNNAGQVQLYVDNQPALSLPTTLVRRDPLDPTSLNIDFLALEYYAGKAVVAATAFDAWIDEIAVDVNKIGCNR